MHNCHRDAIKANLFKLVCIKDGKKEIFVKLLIIYFMRTVFFPNTSLNMLAFTTRYADDLASLGYYAWVHAIYRRLIADLPLTAVRVQLW